MNCAQRLVAGLLLVLTTFVGCAQTENRKRSTATHRSELERGLTRISADSLRGNLSFLASDALAGRWTSSPGLTVAAEFLTSRFRAAGLKPASGNSFLQTADLTDLARQSPEMRRRTIKAPIVASNVAAILPGSDTKLKDTYLLISAHYDHLGTLETSDGLTKDKAEQNGDRIFNGADDDGSGTVSVIEIAAALAKLPKPKRSIVFILFCGEELGLLGSQYYAAHPLYPLERTVANLNLEQVGRSDPSVGENHITMTGYGYTSMTGLFELLAPQFGFTSIRTRESDAYFEASDNFSFAKKGVPDLTLSTAYEFPDYHRLGDEWQKIDYPMMARVARLTAAVIWKIANDPQAPTWVTANEKARQFAPSHPPANSK